MDVRFIDCKRFLLAFKLQIHLIPVHLMPAFNYQQFQCLRQISLPLRNAMGQEEQFYQFRMTPDWQYLITVSYLTVNGKRSLPEIMRFWNWRTGEVEQTVELQTPFLYSELMTPDGQYSINKAAQNQSMCGAFKLEKPCVNSVDIKAWSHV